MFKGYQSLEGTGIKIGVCLCVSCWRLHRLMCVQQCQWEPGAANVFSASVSHPGPAVKEGGGVRKKQSSAAQTKQTMAPVVGPRCHSQRARPPSLSVSSQLGGKQRSCRHRAGGAVWLRNLLRFDDKTLSGECVFFLLAPRNVLSRAATS